LTLTFLQPDLKTKDFDCQDDAMPKPRKQQIALCETPYYHLISRCVRCAFLCGSAETYNFEHRRGWILDRLHLLTQMFAIDIAAFALMSNHYHLVVRVDSAKASGWSHRLKGGRPVLPPSNSWVSSLTGKGAAQEESAKQSALHF
jgi:hypothetical protein